MAESFIASSISLSAIFFLHHLTKIFSSSMCVRSLGRSRAGQSGLRVTWLQWFVGLCLSFFWLEGTPRKLSEVALKSVLSGLII